MAPSGCVTGSHNETPNQTATPQSDIGSTTEADLPSRLTQLVELSQRRNLT